jgi:hypothetical protein
VTETLSRKPTGIRPILFKVCARERKLPANQRQKIALWIVAVGGLRSVRSLDIPASLRFLLTFITDCDIVIAICDRRVGDLKS